MTENLQQSLDKLGDTYERVHNNIIALKTTVSQQAARIKELEGKLEAAERYINKFPYRQESHHPDCKCFACHGSKLAASIEIPNVYSPETKG